MNFSGSSCQETGNVCVQVYKISLLALNRRMSTRLRRLGAWAAGPDELDCFLLTTDTTEARCSRPSPH